MSVTSCLLFLASSAAPDRRAGAMLLEPPPHSMCVEPTLAAQRPREGPTSLGEVETPRTQVHVGTASGKPAAGVGHQSDLRTGPFRDDTEQCGFLRPMPASHARAHRCTQA